MAQTTSYPMASTPTLPAALEQASTLCYASPAQRAYIYVSTDPSVTADSVGGEKYLIFVEEDQTREHLNDEQGWRLCYAIDGFRN